MAVSLLVCTVSPDIPWDAVNADVEDGHDDAFCVKDFMDSWSTCETKVDDTAWGLVTGKTWNELVNLVNIGDDKKLFSLGEKLRKGFSRYLDVDNALGVLWTNDDGCSDKSDAFVEDEWSGDTKKFPLPDPLPDALNKLVLVVFKLGSRKSSEI